MRLLLSSSRLVLFALAAETLTAQSLYDAIKNIPELSNFTEFYGNNLAFSDAVFGNSSTWPITVLVPNNNAFATYQEQTGVPLAEAGLQLLLQLVNYHTLVSSLDKGNFTDGGANGGGSGFSAPTMLMNEDNNNRSVGISMAARFGGPQKSSGQVVFIKPATSDGATSKFLLSRQNGAGPTNSIRSGRAADVNLTALDDTQGTWDGGRFHIIDGLLTPPVPCSATVRSTDLTSLDRALNRTKLWSTVDHIRNVTCLGPNNQAFADAGSPEENLDENALDRALHFHTLPQVAYSDYLEDGMEFMSLDNLTVRVKVEGEGKERVIWFNNARVVEANVLTNNGLVHVLDAIMKPLDDNANGTASATPSSTASATGAAASTGAASPVVMESWDWGVLALLAVMALAMTGSGQWLLIR